MNRSINETHQLLFQCNSEKNRVSTISAKHLDSCLFWAQKYRDFMKVEGMDCDSVNDMVVIKHITNREGTKLITENTKHQSDSQNLLRSSYFTPNDHCFSLFSLQLHTFWVAYVKNIVCTVLKTILFGQNSFAFNETRDTLNTIKVLTVVLHFILHHSNKN